MPRHWSEWKWPIDDLRDLTDFWVVGIVGIGLILITWAIWRTIEVGIRTGRYLRLAKKLGSNGALSQTRSGWSQRKGCRLASDFNDMLVEVPRAGAPLERDLKRCGPASEVFNTASMGQGIVGSRLLMATPAILTGLGVLGTFVGLAMGIGGLDLGSENIEDLDKSISPLIKGSSTAFVTSVWGVTCSILFTLVEKILEWFAVRRIRSVQTAFDSLAPRYTPEESMIALHRSSSQQEEILKGLAVAIGEQMQKAINRIGEGITEAVKEALGGQAQDLGKMSADLMSKALTDELANLQQAVTGMSDGFKTEFGAASEKLSSTISGFDTLLNGVDSTVKSSQTAMTQAVERLTAHEEVVKGLQEGAANLQKAATELSSMRETFTLSAEKNAEAAGAQEKAASKNELVADKLDKIGDKLPEVQEAVASGAQIIASLGQPLLELKEILSKTPEILGGQAEEQAVRDEKRSSLLLQQTEVLANTVAEAATKFAQIETLATSLSTSAVSLEKAGSALGQLSANISSASEKQVAAANASEKAAAAGERAAEKLEPIPGSLEGLSGTLETASSKIKEGADAARDVYRELVEHQKQWIQGVELGLTAMRDRLQDILDQYGESVEGNTRNHMELWTRAVNESLSKFSAQVQILEGAVTDLTNEMNN
ncbi:anti-phage defense ZorAB system ZorA [Akkermansiaceae bacterium]|nr:anti-phage defense ZorAB system ZorA [Akkermansiaceae bacterium]